MTNPITRLNAALEGRYVIERELGEGGMATVYLAEDLCGGGWLDESACTAEMTMTTTVIHCPHCGNEANAVIPDDARLIVYECPYCHAALRPERGDCRVFCSYSPSLVHRRELLTSKTSSPPAPIPLQYRSDG